jgi:hypothetical protein
VHRGGLGTETLAVAPQAPDEQRHAEDEQGVPRIEPVREAFTIWVSFRRMSRIEMISSVMFPNVALSSPPARGPARIASCSVERPINAARGRIASAEVKKTASSCCRKLKARETGMKMRSHSSLGFVIDLTSAEPFRRDRVKP